MESDHTQDTWNPLQRSHGQVVFSGPRERTSQSWQAFPLFHQDFATLTKKVFDLR